MAALEERVDRLSALLEPIVAEDPLLNSSQWQAERDGFKTVLGRNRDDFAALVAAGLMREGARP